MTTKGCTRMKLLIQNAWFRLTICISFLQALIHYKVTTFFLHERCISIKTLLQPHGDDAQVIKVGK